MTDIRATIQPFVFDRVGSVMECRLGCGACCIAPSITSPIPGMPDGKPAGERCIQLSDENLCRIFGNPERPAVCEQFKADIDICGSTDQYALITLTALEVATGSESSN